MNFIWDETKRAANLEKHGLDFGAIDEAFFEDAIIKAARGERFQAVGTLSGVSVVVSGIFSRLGTEAISIISLRRANKKERKFLNAKET